jgi:TPR repeat protein
MKWFLKFFLCALLVLGAGNSSAATLDDGLNAFAAGEFEKANSIFERLAKSGNASAQFQLGMSYQLGRGLEKNDVLAVKWLEAAAQQKLPLACLHMGMAYEAGRGVERDYVRAYKMYDVAASKASTDTNRKAAEKKRDYVMKKMSPLERARAR